MAKVELSPRADDDVREVWFYTERTWSERQAQAYVDALFDRMEMLAAEPSRGLSADELSEGLRRCRCASHVIFYRVTTEGIFVVRVLHAHMDFAAHLGEDM